MFGNNLLQNVNVTFALTRRYTLNGFQKGFSEVAIGIIGGIIISALLSGFAKDGLITSNMVFLLTFVGF